MNFDKWILSCNLNHNQYIKHFNQPKSLPMPWGSYFTSSPLDLGSQ